MEHPRPRAGPFVIERERGEDGLEARVQADLLRVAALVRELEDRPALPTVPHRPHLHRQVTVEALRHLEERLRRRIVVRDRRPHLELARHREPEEDRLDDRRDTLTAGFQDDEAGR